MGMVWNMVRTNRASGRAASKTKTDLLTLYRPDQSHNPWLRPGPPPNIRFIRPNHYFPTFASSSRRRQIHYVSILLLPTEHVERAFAASA